MGSVLFLAVVFLLFMMFVHRGDHREPEHAGRGSHGQHGGGGTFWMLVVCLLPLILLFALGGMGIAVSPTAVIVALLLGCAAMFFVGHGRAAPEEDAPEPPSDEDFESLEERFRDSARIASVAFDSQGFRMAGEGQAMVLEGRLRGDPDQAYAKLREAFGPEGVTPMLEDGPGGCTRLVLAPSGLFLAQAGTGRPRLHALLFVLTLGTTTWAGAAHQGLDPLTSLSAWAAGLPYALGLMLILGTHELGHYVAARRHGMSVSLPYFIPVPFALGTFGAFIQMRSVPRHRKALFDVGIAGPLAGLAIALPALFVGLRLSVPVLGGAGPESLAAGMDLGTSALMTFIAELAIGDALIDAHRVVLHPLAFAGWLGLLLTALNLLPIGQLDGGHVVHALVGRRTSRAIGAAAMFGLVALGLFVWTGLLTWAILVFFLAGGQGIGPMNDIVPVNRTRIVLGAVAFVLLFLILAPIPHTLYGAIGIHCPYL